jgi:glycosyltransferase involved in cell wall biosynthesis
LDAIRGIHQFAEFAEKIIKINQKIKIIVVGSIEFSYSGDEISNIRKYSIDKLMQNIDQKEKDRIFFLGKIKHEELKALYKISKINIYITMPFPLSWSMLESMAATCMVVASNTGPVKEIIQNRDNGVLFEYGNIPELIKIVQYYVNNESQRIKIAKNGEKYIKENYDFEKIIFPKYKKLLGLN